MNMDKTIFAFILSAVALTASDSTFVFRGVPNSTAPAATRALVIDSDQLRDRIHAEELRQAEENRRIRELPPPKPKDPASAKAHLEAGNKLVDLQARAAFLSDLKALATVDVPSSAQGVVVSWSKCRCTLFPTSPESLVKVRFKLRAEHRTVEGWVCSDAIRMLHPSEL
jgi:hypothetical protein